MGLPASIDVGVLASVLQELQRELETELNITITYATLAVPHLLALYQDDAQDILEYLQLEYIEPKNQFRPMLWEAAAAFAGQGLGLCRSWADKDKCHAEEEMMPDHSVLALHYSRTALLVSMARLSTAISLWNPDYRRKEVFGLGSNAFVEYDDPEAYWAKVNETMAELVDVWKPPPDMVLLTGDDTSDLLDDFIPRLRSFLKNALGDQVPMPDMLADDVTLVAARGAAELNRRARAM
jgi:hypothetical protein